MGIRYKTLHALLVAHFNNIMEVVAEPPEWSKPQRNQYVRYMCEIYRRSWPRYADKSNAYIWTKIQAMFWQDLEILMCLNMKREIEPTP